VRSAIHSPQLVVQSAEEKFASACTNEDTLSNRPDVIAELECYLSDARRLAPSHRRHNWRARLQVLAESL
jgi:hypothetical protein